MRKGPQSCSDFTFIHFCFCIFLADVLPLCVSGVRAQCSSRESPTLTVSVWSSLPIWSQPSLLWHTWPSSWRSRTRMTRWVSSSLLFTLPTVPEYRLFQTCPSDVLVSLPTYGTLLTQFCVCVLCSWQETGSSSPWWWTVSSCGCLSSSPPWELWLCSWMLVSITHLTTPSHSGFHMHSSWSLIHCCHFTSTSCWCFPRSPDLTFHNIYSIGVWSASEMLCN